MHFAVEWMHRNQCRLCALSGRPFMLCEWKMLWEKCINTISWNDCHIFLLHNSHYCIICDSKKKLWWWWWWKRRRKQIYWGESVVYKRAQRMRIWEMHILFKRWANTKKACINVVLLAGWSVGRSIDVKKTTCPRPCNNFTNVTFKKFNQFICYEY